MEFIINTILLIASVTFLMFPFIIVIILSMIATVLGWIGIISLSYIAVLNLIILRNFSDIPIIKNHWKDPSERIIKFLFKAILSAIIIYLYLIITIIVINNLLIPLGEELTMNFIVGSLVSSEGMKLSFLFHSVTFLLIGIYFAYMKFTLSALQNWFITEIIDPAKQATEHAINFARRLGSGSK